MGGAAHERPRSPLANGAEKTSRIAASRQTDPAGKARVFRGPAGGTDYAWSGRITDTSGVAWLAPNPRPNFHCTSTHTSRAITGYAMNRP